MVQTNWTSLGKPANNITLSSPHAVQNADGRLEVLLNGSDGNLWHIWQITPGKNWGTWTSLSKPPATSFVTIPVATKNDNVHIAVVSICVDGNLWRIWQKTPGNGWGNWSSSGQPPVKTSGPTLPPAVVQNLDGRLEVFLLGADGAIWHIWQNAPNGTWSNWASLSKPPTAAIA